MKWIEHENFWLDDTLFPYEEAIDHMKNEVTHQAEPTTPHVSWPPLDQNPDKVILDETEEGALWDHIVSADGEVLFDGKRLFDTWKRTFYRIGDTLDWRKVNEKSKLYADLMKKYKDDIEEFERAKQSK